MENIEHIKQTCSNKFCGCTSLVIVSKEIACCPACSRRQQIKKGA